MLHKKNLIKMIALITATVLIASVMMLGSVYASEEYPPLDSKGSISVTIKDRETGDPVPGGKLVFYRAAEIVDNGGYQYQVTKDFASFQEPITNDTNFNDTLAAGLAAFASQNSLKGTAVSIGTDGKATASDLSLGLYLIVQTEPAPNHVTIDPFLVTVPFKTESGEWVLDVDATPKPDLAQECAPISVSLTAEKKITGEKAPSATFDFVFKRQGTSPMPVNAKGLVSAGGPVVKSSADEMTLQIKGAGQVTIGEITFDKSGEYYYTCSEKNTGEKDFTYDTTTYWCKIGVVQEGDALVIDEIVLKKGGAEGTVVYTGKDASKALFTFTNAYKAPEKPTEPPKNPSSKLPQTGQLWWPVMLLAVIGIVLLVSGAVIRRRR